MGDLPLSLIFLLIVLILLSAFFSASETAFSSVNKIRLKNYVDEKRRGSKKALYIAENFDQALSTILVGNNIVNIAAASISAKVATDLFGGSTGLVISTVGMTILILIFGEVLPKSLAKEHAESFSLLISDVLYMLIQLFTPVTALLVMLKKVVSKLVGQRTDVPSVTEEEIKVMVNLSEEEGVIDNKEKELVHRSLDFNDILVGEIFTPRIDMVAVEVNQPVEEIRDIFLRERYSRVPVYEGDIDNVIGILSESDFFSQLVQGKEVNVRQLLRTPLFVVESMRISTLLPELQKSKVHMAIVIDEFGGTSGLITLEDILEQIVGEIWDEHDEAVKTFQKINDYEYEFNAELPLDEFCDILGIDELESSSHTLGGWVFEMFERIPTVGESFEYESLTVTVRQVENRRIRKVLVRIREPIVENV
ncbi:MULTISPECIES: hemolysin family protein [Anoxybacillus]|uniref:HlyC/CorC family transporter n=1 Tax=Anoxybacillus flavithermus TaxID=33934 RepID=A0A178TCR4_9BACL|nr:hemolysin family protein [Anoxybacillus flavithermus]ASA96696.1 HlyC/CorC family transporter [Anoxybacillus flavithermus]ELK21201.1 transporter [Anoxybacillus flavithermus TNO-09.006]MBE2906120.1 HlyC/CorC family transporter [Anoxybacillus flavithermus]MBE2907347.1 HlyC/CorC family transporter [Anoxybacillus flavithermus]MBE2909886.1 HlyC/CorC family transporter [Anoxybacillus flavithermus]